MEEDFVSPGVTVQCVASRLPLWGSEKPAEGHSETVVYPGVLPPHILSLGSLETWLRSHLPTPVLPWAHRPQTRASLESTTTVDTCIVFWEWLLPGFRGTVNVYNCLCSGNSSTFPWYLLKWEMNPKIRVVNFSVSVKFSSPSPAPPLQVHLPLVLHTSP